MDSFLRGVTSSLMEVGLATFAGGALNRVFMNLDADDDKLPTLLLRLVAHAAVNGLTMATLSRVGLARFETPTGLAIFSVFFILNQPKFYARSQRLQTLCFDYFNKAE
jgi:hypothetical protein